MGGRIGEVHSQSCVLIRSDAVCRLKVKLHDEFGHPVAHCLLPYQFIVKANSNSVSDDEPQAPIEAQQQTLCLGFPGSNSLSASVWELRSPKPPASFHPLAINQHSQPNSNYLPSLLQRLAPAEGLISGGPTILLSGVNFPSPSQQIVYAKFGSVVVPTV